MMNIVCIQASNSLSFVNAVFDAYINRQLFAISHHNSLQEFNLHTGLAADEFIFSDAKQDQRWFDGKTPGFDSNEPAQIVFTSGTEGKPKTIVLSYSNLKNVVDRINQAMDVDSTIKEYIGIPVYHSFGLGRCRAVAAAGGKAFIPAKGFDLNEIKTMLEADEINAISAVPSLWRILLDNHSLFVDVAHKVKWIEIGSQFMSADEKKQLSKLFHAAKIVQHYGLTEASRTTLLRIDQSTDEQLESVGVPSDSTQLKISPDGVLAIKGEHVALGRIEEGEIISLTDDDGWFYTSDLCEINDHYLYFKGRADDVINCGGVKFDPASIESELNKGCEQEDYIYLSRIPDAYRGDGVLVTLSESSSRDKDEILSAVDLLLSEKNINARSAIKFNQVTEITKTATGKIKRNKLSENYLDKVVDLPKNEKCKTVESLYCSTFGIEKVEATDTFSSLGGDSLTYVKVSIEIENILGSLPDQWEQIPVSELSSIKNDSPLLKRAPKLEMGIFLRFLAIVAVVSHHAGVSLVKGGATLLMLIAGYNYVRFQLLKQFTGNPFSIGKSLLLNILLPYWMVIIGFLVLKGHPIGIADLLLYSNVIYPKYPYVPFQIWFIHVLVQCILVFSIPLLFSSIRNWAKDNTFEYILTFTVIFYVLRILDEYYGFGYQYNLGGGQTSWVAWLFALGALIFVIETTKAKLWASLLVVISAFTFYEPDYSRVFMIAVGGLLVIWVTQISLPKALLPLVQIVSSASLFIYMLHGRAPVGSATADWTIDIIRIGVGILIGVVVYFIYNWGLSVLFYFNSLLTKFLNKKG
jgi:acyl-CoA synthetase (AMP-forming)/AMP-acid ligase II